MSATETQTVKLPCSWCGDVTPPGQSSGICDFHLDEQMAVAVVEAGRAGAETCSRCEYWRLRNRPCPHSAIGREVAIDYGYAG